MIFMTIPSAYSSTRGLFLFFLLSLCIPAGKAASTTQSRSPSQPITDERHGDDAIFAAQENIQILKTTQDNQSKARSPGVTPRELSKIRVAQQAIDERRDANAAQFPDSFEVQNTAAASAVQAGDWKKARLYSDQAVALAQANNDARGQGSALRVRALGAYQSGDYPQAASDARKALDLFPDDSDARVIYQFSKDRTRALPGAAPRPQSLSLPSVLEDSRVVAAGRRAADRVSAIKKLEEAMRLLGGGPNMAPAAVEAAAAAPRLDASLADASMHKALAWQAMGDLAKALPEAERAIGLWTLQGRPQNLAAAYTLRAKLAVDGRKYLAARSDAERALVYDPAFASAYLQRARASEALGADAAAILADYKRAAELEPDFKSDYQAAVARASASRRPPAGARREGRRGLGLLGPAAAVVLAVMVLLGGRRKPKAPPFSADVERKVLKSQYEIVGSLGNGGMGEVYEGWDTVLKRPVAIKRLRVELQANERERERFIREAELVASLHHPHIVEIYNIIQDAQETHLIFEFVSGKTVENMLNENPGRHLSAARALEILRPIAEAVDHAHSRQVIHRDLKPANVMIADGGWVKVMDFGIARQVKDSLLTTTNTIVGTPVYMAPEQAMGAVVKESDVFSLGVTLYELLTGGLPFKGPGEMNDKMQGAFLSPSHLVPEVGSDIDHVLAKAFAARPSERYPSCGDLYSAAAAALGGQTAASR